jgi:hypothetical protein
VAGLRPPVTPGAFVLACLLRVVAGLYLCVALQGLAELGMVAVSAPLALWGRLITPPALLPTLVSTLLAGAIAAACWGCADVVRQIDELHALLVRGAPAPQAPSRLSWRHAPERPERGVESMAPPLLGGVVPRSEGSGGPGAFHGSAGVARRGPAVAGRP